MKKEHYWAFLTLLVIAAIGYGLYHWQKISKNVQMVSDKTNRNLDAQFELQRLEYQAKLQEQLVIVEQQRQALTSQPIERKQIGFKKG